MPFGKLLPPRNYPATSGEQATEKPRLWDLDQGSYMVEFNELVATPLDCMGDVYPRSSLFRSGGLIFGGVCDAGYRGRLGGCCR